MRTSQIKIAELPVTNAVPETAFDDIVIGSSPMMLLQAGMLARGGRRVCLVEREENLGGSWQIARLDNGERVEIACHVIECFPGIYEFLESASGAPFEPLQAQPIRIHPSGMIFPYFSRILMLATGVRLVLGLVSAKLSVAFGKAKDRNRLINFQKKLTSYLHHQISAFFQCPIMQGPKHGFVDFMDRLVERNKREGVIIRRFDVAKMKRSEDNRWYVADLNGVTLSAEHVHCTTSTNLHKISPGYFESKPQEFARRLSIVAEVPKEGVKISQTYVAFWADPLVARISRIDMPKPQLYERYLLEFRNHDFTSQTDWLDKIREHMERAKIIDKNGVFRIVGKVDCRFTMNVDQLPAGKIDTNFRGYYSMGNLAAGLAAWRKSERIPPLSGKNTTEKGVA